MSILCPTAICHPGGGRDPEYRRSKSCKYASISWIPASAGMTNFIHTSALVTFCFCMLVGSWANAQSSESTINMLSRGQPLSEAQVDKAMKDEKNAAYIAMLEAFALFRQGDVGHKDTQALILKYLTYAENSFADLRQPDNFSLAFSADANTPYRGRPHERVATALMLALMDMVRGRYDIALPALKNAEFLDARWQSMPYGTDAPLIYALMMRSLTEMKSSPQDIERARQGLYRSVRLLVLQDPLIAAATQIAQAGLRNSAVSVQIAQVLMGAGLSSALIIADDKATIFDIVQAGAKEAASYVSLLEDKFAGEFERFVKPMLANSASVVNMPAKEFSDFSFKQVSVELTTYARQIIKLLKARPAEQNKLSQLKNEAQAMSKEIEQAVLAPRVILRFEGLGPRIERSGQYNEVANVVKSPSGSVKAEIRRKNILSGQKCGLSNKGGNLTVVLCDKNEVSLDEFEEFTGLELFSSSRKATTVMGRRFASVLAGRADFRATTESIATIGAFTTLALLNVSSNLMAQGYAHGSKAAFQQGAAVGGAALVAAGVSGAIFLIGKSVNPEADPRFVAPLYESGYLLVPKR